MTWIIDEADTERGVPTRAHCERCGFAWERPENDDYADTLPLAARLHRRVCKP